MKKKQTNKELAKEVRQWEQMKCIPNSFKPVTSAIPRQKDTISISICIPKLLLTLIKQCAHNKGLEYQVLIKQWLDEKIRAESRN